MLVTWSLMFSILLYSAFATKPNVDPEYLDMLRETGRHEEFAKLLGIEDVNLVHPQEGRTEEELMFTTVSALGDILLTPDQDEQARNGLNFKVYTRSKWTNNEVPYEIGENEGFTIKQIASIESALIELDKELKNVKIVPRTNQIDYVYVMNGRGCYSYLGKRGGQQPLSLQASGCVWKGVIMHEMMHAMGLHHEQCRSDRDDYVEVLFENIPKEWHSQYQKVNPKYYNNLGPYDPYSVMHYPMRATNGKLAFKFHDPSVDTRKVGWRPGPSDIDKQKADALYS